MKNKKNFRWFSERLNGLKGRLVLVTLGDSLFSILSTVFVLLCKYLIDSSVNQDEDKVKLYILLLFLVTVAELFLRIFLNLQREYLRAKMNQRVREHTYEVLLSKDYASIKSIHSGEWMNLLFSDVSVIGDGINILPNLVSMTVRLICCAVILFIFTPIFTAVLLSVGILMILLLAFLRKKMKSVHKEVQKAKGKVESNATETLNNLLVVKTFSAEETMKQREEEKEATLFKAEMKRRSISLTANSTLIFVFQIGYLLAVIYGSLSLFHQTMTYGTLLVLVELVSLIQSPIYNLSSILPRVYSLEASIERIREVEAFHGEKESNDILEGFDSLSFEDVSFSYPGKEPVLNHVSFRLNRGDICALTGISGGGKSTLFTLLLGIYTDYQGKIVLGSEEKEYVPNKNTRALFSYVPQGNMIFSGTIKENILFAQPEEDERFQKAIDSACLREVIDSLPDHENTYLLEGGKGLSEGQIQRIAIARAIYSNRPVMLLDECTSALDEQTEARVLTNIKALGKTCFIVTHRNQALSICTRHFVLEDGNIKEIEHE